MKISSLFSDFFNSEKAGGVVLIACTAVSLILANSAFSEQYIHFWHSKLAGNSIEYWINDGLMAIFFLLIGLELEREIYKGELSNIKDAMLPVAGALGGMLVPAAIFLLFNFDTPEKSGAGIPMATDIAFALGILSLLGNKVPSSLKVFLTALAVIDDLGAILVIAIFYSGGLAWGYLTGALAIWGGLFILNRMKVHGWLPYLVGGVAMWYCMLHSGVHATIAGVLLAFVIPFGDGSKKTLSYRLQHALHKPVAFIIMPVFALANTAINIQGGMTEIFEHSYSAGIATGLIVGKPLGIFLLSLIAVKTGLCKLPGDIGWKEIIGVGFLGGIGFTMSIFITLLAFDNSDVINNAKIIILVSSLVAGLIGYISLKLILKKQHEEEIAE
jgi:Na+:H+ antiporter, NhaA family